MRINHIGLFAFSATFGLTIGFLNAACHPGDPAKVVNDVSPAAACVVGELVTGVTDPWTIVGACAGTAVESVIAIIDDLIASPAFAVDGGLAATPTGQLVTRAQLEHARSNAVQAKLIGHP